MRIYPHVALDAVDDAGVDEIVVMYCVDTHISVCITEYSPNLVAWPKFIEVIELCHSNLCRAVERRFEHGEDVNDILDEANHGGGILDGVIPIHQIIRIITTRMRKKVCM